jgi:hypothetical protein
LLAGCGASAPAQFYTLSATAAPSGRTASDAVLVGPVSVPPAVDRPQFVVQVADNRVTLDEFNRWASPLDDAIARAVAGNLASILGTPDVAVAPLANFDPAYRVTIDVQRFDSVQARFALVDAVWAVRSTHTNRVQSGRTLAREDVAGDGFDALAAAHSRALAKMSEDIAAVIQAARKTR